MADSKISEWTAEMKKLRSITENDCSLYSDPYYGAFLDNSGEEATVDWAQEKFGKEVVADLAGKFRKEEEIRFLAVGCGKGIHEREFIKQLSLEFSRLTFVAIEPNAAGITGFKDAVNKDGVISGVTFKWRQETLAQYRRASPRGREKYHVISTIHSLYYVDNLEEDVGYLLSALEEGGILIVNLISERSKFYRLLTDKPWLSCNMLNVTSNQVSRIARDAGYQVKSWPFTPLINITDVFDEGSALGARMLDFLTFTHRFQEAAPRNIRSDLLEFLGSEDIATRKDGSVYMENDGELLIIGKWSV